MTRPKKLRAKQLMVRCPHCDERATIRTSEQLLPTQREMRAVCENEECGHAFVIDMTVVRTVVPSRIPNPDVHLPFSNPNLTAQRPKPANDDVMVPTPANDDVPDIAAVDPMTG